MAGVPSIPFYENRYGVTTDDSASTNDAVSSHDISKASSIIDSLRNDTVELDSLHLAILRHNKAVDDSLTQDSLNKTKKNGIDSPVEFSANDSLVFIASTGMANLYGENANVQLPISEKELNEARERTKARRDQFRTQILSQLDSIDKRLKERRNEKDTWGLDMRLHGAQRKLDDIREALKQGDLARSKDVWKELKGMWSGLASGVGDPDLYSLGVISAIDNMNRVDAINKYANDEALTDTQKDMLELEATGATKNDSCYR